LLVFWWTGKGYLTPVILMAVLIAFGVMLQIPRPYLHDEPWLWGGALVCSAAVNWRVGVNKNAKKRAAVRSRRLRDRLIYPARNKFMSLPFETWSIPLAIGGLSAIFFSIVTD
jgi:hypothetical protein